MPAARPAGPRVRSGSRRRARDRPEPTIPRPRPPRRRSRPAAQPAPFPPGRSGSPARRRKIREPRPRGERGRRRTAWRRACASRRLCVASRSRFPSAPRLQGREKPIKVESKSSTTGRTTRRRAPRRLPEGGIGWNGPPVLVPVPAGTRLRPAQHGRAVRTASFKLITRTQRSSPRPRGCGLPRAIGRPGPARGAPPLGRCGPCRRSRRGGRCARRPGG